MKKQLQKLVSLTDHQGLKKGQHYLLVEKRTMWVCGMSFATYFVSPVREDGTCDRSTVLQVNNGHLLFGFVD